MSGCRNHSLGKRLHAFELGLLTGEERREFEEHLLECSHCFELAARHEKAINLLKNDTKLQNDIIESAGENSDLSAEGGSVEPRGRYRSILRMSLAAVLLLAMVYMFSRDTGLITTIAQVIRFDQLRSADQAVVYLDREETVTFEFPTHDPEGADSIRVSIRPIDGEELLSERMRVAPQTYYLNISASIDLFESGLYYLTIEAIPSGTDISPSVYTFRVK